VISPHFTPFLLCIKLNISGETLQQNKFLHVIKKNQEDACKELFGNVASKKDAYNKFL